MRSSYGGGSGIERMLEESPCIEVKCEKLVKSIRKLKDSKEVGRPSCADPEAHLVSAAFFGTVILFFLLVFMPLGDSMAPSGRQVLDLLSTTADPRQRHRLVALVELGQHQQPIEACPDDTVDHMSCEDPRRNRQLSRWARAAGLSLVVVISGEAEGNPRVLDLRQRQRNEARLPWSFVVCEFAESDLEEGRFMVVLMKKRKGTVEMVVWVIVIAGSVMMIE
ncbi:hypothetical protein M0R45_015411 [Rubus argutus]|uniref:Uncharacterized protein n=1 Tax=Rubus argutus TaxID=59490 RepID=A0AAW1XQG9_RUBAR